jgi:hypothetical protein
MPRTVATARSVATARTAASQRLVIRPYTKTWAFNGINSCASCAALNLSAYNKIAIDFFLKIDATTNNPMILELSANSAANNDCFYLDFNESATYSYKLLAVQKVAAGYSGWASAQLHLRSFMHVILVMDRALPSATATKIYINGVVSGSSAASTADPTGNFGNRSFNVGARNGGASLQLRGNIKDVRICTFTGSFIANDALSIYQNIIPTNFTDLNRWLGEDAAGTATDSVGSTNLTLTNTTYDTGHVPCIARTLAT